LLLSPWGIQEWQRWQHQRNYQAYLDEAEALVHSYNANLIDLIGRGPRRLDPLMQDEDSKRFHSAHRRLLADYRARCRELRLRYALPPDKKPDEDLRWEEGLTPWD
jgi:hypothetical protein